jgi:VCBS repeat-containing protein
MSRHSFRPQLEQLGERCLPSVNPVLSISSVAHPEGNSGQTAYVFTVNLSKASPHQVSVNYATADGSATVADHDYVPTAGTLTFARGETAKTITVLVNGDNVAEPNESLFVNLSGASRATIANATGVGTIQNDDAPDALVAVYDSNWTDPWMPVNGNVLANDTNTLTGGTLTVSTVNGSAANVGTQIQLASGALLTINADGSYTYNPNHAFDWIPAGYTAWDSFTYTAANSLGVESNTATVSIAITHSISGDPCDPDGPNPWMC